MKNYYMILFVLLFSMVLSQCSDPLAVDAVREKTVKWDPDSVPPLFEVVPQGIINLGQILPDDSLNTQFSIKNISNQNVTINSLTLKNNPNHAVFTLPQSPIVLKPQGTNGDKAEISMNFHALSVGYFSDTIIFEGFKNPKIVVKAELPAVFARDVDFQDCSVDSLSLKILNIYNRSSVKVTITEFKIDDSELVFLNEPAFQTPYVINPNSVSDDIKITFGPKKAETFVKQIRFKAVFDNPASNTLYPIDEIVVLKGRGVH